MSGNDNDPSLARFEQTVLPHLPAAYNLASWLMRDPHDAEDVVQQSSLRAWRAFDSFRGDRSEDARSWFLAIVRNACFTEIRRRRGGPPITREPLDDHDVAAPDHATDPSNALIQRLDAEALAAAIEKLPEVFREAFVLREMEDLSYSQIAEVSGVPVGTVMSRLARARRRLCEMLKEDDEDNDADEAGHHHHNGNGRLIPSPSSPSSSSRNQREDR